MSTDRLQTFAAFLRVFETESFSEVAREMGVAQPTVSRLIASLEASLGAQLFSRSTRRVTPTTDAQRIYRKVKDLVDAIAEIEADAAGRSSEASGFLRVTSPASFGRTVLVPKLPAFFEQFPLVTIDMRLRNRSIDMIEDGSELAIQIGDLPSSSLIAKRVGFEQKRLVVSSSFLKTRVPPQSPEDLENLSCILDSGVSGSRRWAFDSDLGRRVVEVNGRLSLDSEEAIAEAVLAGVGVALLPTWLLRDEVASGQVKILLPDHHPIAAPISVVYPKARWLSNRARCFIAYVSECLSTS